MQSFPRLRGRERMHRSPLVLLVVAAFACPHVAAAQHDRWASTSWVDDLNFASVNAIIGGLTAGIASPSSIVVSSTAAPSLIQYHSGAALGASNGITRNRGDGWGDNAASLGGGLGAFGGVFGLFELALVQRALGNVLHMPMAGGFELELLLINHRNTYCRIARCGRRW